MKIVIDIDKNEYIGIKSFPVGNTSYPWTLHLYDAVRNGTPLSEVLNEIKGEIIRHFDDEDAEYIMSIIDKHIGKEQK